MKTLDEWDLILDLQRLCTCDRSGPHPHRLHRDECLTSRALMDVIVYAPEDAAAIRRAHHPERSEAP